LHVTAKDKGTGKEQKIRIEAGSGLTKDEIEKMKNDAKMNEAADKVERERVEKLNMADSLVFQTEKQLKEYGEKIPAEKKTAIEVAASKLKEAHKAQDLAAIETATTELNAAWTAASQDIYNAQQQQPGAEQPAGDGKGQQQQQPGAENVQDVPFEEVK
jgi:molecular chaperone DnaK